MLARHSTSALTLDVYTHIGIHDERRAIEKLPKLHSPDDNCRAVALKKTGTDDKPIRLAENGQEQLTPKLTPFSTPTAFPACNQSATVGNEQDNIQENSENGNCLNSGDLGIKKDSLALAVTGEKEKPTDGFEPSTPGLQNQSSTVELRWHKYLR